MAYRVLSTYLLILIILIFNSSKNIQYSYASNEQKNTTHLHSESSYQHAWCSAHNGIEEYENSDKTRVDCLTQTHAVEFDFANKWAESIGQAIHYHLMTGKRAKVVLILENPSKQIVYFNRIQNIGKFYDIDVEYVTTAILNPQNGRCDYLDCKCNKNSTSILH